LADVTGRTESVIFQETLKLYGIEDSSNYFQQFVQAQAEGYAPAPTICVDETASSQERVRPFKHLPSWPRSQNRW
jgi:hypothetical protein